FSNDVRELRLAAKFSRQELLRAQFANKMGPISTDIQREKMEHVRLGLLMREEQIAWFGSEEFNLKGYLSEETGIEKTFNGNNAPKLDGNASADQMFTILDTGVTKVANTEIEKPNTIA